MSDLRGIKIAYLNEIKLEEELIYAPNFTKKMKSEHVIYVVMNKMQFSIFP